MSRFFQGRAGLVVLLCAFPAVLLGALVPANRYVAQGFAGVDCEGPMHVLVFAVPVLLLYGFGAIANASRRGRSPRPLVVLGCALACAAVAVNAADAVAFLHRNATENAGSCGDQRWPPDRP